tara:strand:+ start:142 stop:363 length:222 start_codon:yes stop_codon:yes gene_type:complete
MITLRKIFVILMSIIIGLPLGVLVGFFAFLKFPAEVAISALKKIEEQEKQRKLISEQQEKDIWQRHIDRINNN